MSAGASEASAPTVSVCVTCYNQRQYIGQCLDSIIGQQIDVPIEIIVGDDGSVDGSVELIEEYAGKDSRIVPVVRPRNLGFVENQRDLFERSTGTFVCLVEGDDYWVDPHKLQKQLAIMDAHPDITLCITAGARVSESGEPLGAIRVTDRSRELSLGETILEVNGTVPTASMLMRGTALRRLPKETYDQAPIDYALQVLVGAQGRIWYDASVTSAYRVASVGSWTEGVGTSDEKYLRHHEGLRRYRQFLEREVGPRWAGHVRRAFEPLILGFYMSSRIRPEDKRRNLPEDLPQLSRRAKVIATILTRVPPLVSGAAFARRRVWVPLSRRLRGAKR